MAGDQDRLSPHPRGEKIARRPGLAFVPQNQPGAPEDALHLDLEHGRVGVGGAVNPVGPDQVRKPGKIERIHRRSRSPGRRGVNAPASLGGPCNAQATPSRRDTAQGPPSPPPPPPHTENTPAPPPSPGHPPPRHST